MEMQTGSTNNHFSQTDFFLFAAPMYWWNWLAAPGLMPRYKGGIVMLTALALIDRSMTT
jgi:hypothetical protein